MVSPFLRKVKTASGATAVQIAVKEGRRDKVIEHLGPELAHLVAWTARCFSDSACFVLQAAFFRSRNSLSTSSGVRYPRAE